mgnify:CR=1 FL=1
MSDYREVRYELENIQGTVLIKKNIQDEKEIKEICFKDYLNQLINKIKISK